MCGYMEIHIKGTLVNFGSMRLKETKPPLAPSFFLFYEFVL